MGKRSEGGRNWEGIGKKYMFEGKKNGKREKRGEGFKINLFNPNEKKVLGFEESVRTM